MGFIYEVSDAVIGVLSPGIGRKLIPLKYHVNAAKTVQVPVSGHLNGAGYQVVLERSVSSAEVRSPLGELVFTGTRWRGREIFFN
jgi:hypothetical protein